MNNPEDNQLENKDWKITIGDKINRYREGYGQLTHILEEIQAILDTQQKEIRKEYEKRISDLVNNAWEE